MTDWTSFYGPVDDRTQSTLAKACLEYFRIYLPPDSPWRDRAFADLEHLAPGVRPSEHVDRGLLDEARDRLAGRIAWAPEAALVAQGVMMDRYRAAGNALTAWVLAAALQRRRQYPLDSVIRSGLDAMRRLKKITPGKIALLEPLPADVPGLLERLRQAAGTPGLETKVRRYFDAIAELLEAVESGRPQITRDRVLPVREGIGPDGGQYLTGGFVPLPAAIAGPAALQAADRVPVAHVPVASDDPGNLAPQPVAAARLSGAARAAARRALAVPAEQDPLTPHEVATLVTACRRNGHDPAFQYLLALLSFGAVLPATPQEAPAALSRSDRGPEIRVFVNLPPFDALLEDDPPGPGAASEPRDLAEGLRLAEPIGLDLALLQAGVESRQVAAALQALRPGLARPLTLGRIRRYRQDWLRRAGADPAIIGFLTRTDPAMRAQMHYTAIDKAVLQDWHRRYLADGLSLPAVAVPPAEGRHGSRLGLPLSLVADVFTEQRLELRRHRLGEAACRQRIAAAHNVFLVYTLMVLSLATGHRPVNQPFQYWSDVEGDLLWISDKTGRGDRGTRLVVLCPTARRQLDHWRAHLDHLARLLVKLSPDPDRVVTSLARARPQPSADGPPLPLLFWLDEAARPKPLTADQQEKGMAPVLPTALNWTRHILRSHLVGVHPGEVIDAFLGHAHLGEEAFAPTSALGLRDLRRLAQSIEALLADCGIEAVESPCA